MSNWSIVVTVWIALFFFVSAMQEPPKSQQAAELDEANSSLAGNIAQEL
ncbi:hypothetical protein PF010_g31633, partial [Phytophthora fragariae]